MTEITKRITGNDQDTHTAGGNDPSTNAPHTSATVPNSYPPQPNAGVHIAWGVIAKVNSPGTSTISDTIFCNTTLTNYVTDVPVAVQSVYSLWNQWTAATPQGLTGDGEIHWSIRIDNPTAPAAAMGAYVQAKQHMDGHLSSGNILSANSILDPIMYNIPFMQSVAKY